MKYIKTLYNKKKVNYFEYDIKEIIDRENKIERFVDQFKFFLNYLDNTHILMNSDKKMNSLKLSNDNLKIKINELRLELLRSKNTNKLISNDIHKILSRFLADEILKIIITKYHDKLDKVALKLNIILNLISENKDEIFLNEDILNSIEDISEEFAKTIKEYKNDPKSLKIRKKLLDMIDISSKNQFIEDITVGDELFKKKEINCILDILFFIKKIGNKSAHPNINPDIHKD